MAVSEKTVELTETGLEEIQGELQARGLAGWLLYDFRATNPVTVGVLGLPVLSRRIFVMIPAEGRPTALTHRIEQQPWRTWIGENLNYLSWQSLRDGLRTLLASVDGPIAAEYSHEGSVPYLDRIPAGVAELIRTNDVEIVSSGDLVSAFYSRWSEYGLDTHRRAAAILRETAFAAFDRVRDALREDSAITEWDLRSWIAATLAERGLKVGADSVVAVNANGANPHYAPSSSEHSPITHGDLLLVDLWGKFDDDSVYADQTWMAFVGDEVPDRIQTLWEAIRDARDAAIDLIARRSAAGEAVSGYEADRVARDLIVERGFGDAFIHRTGHSIDRELHGSGPNLDDLESRDDRTLIAGIGFSVEPGIYLPGEVGLRTEVDVFMGRSGPEVTTPNPQSQIELIKL